jgi:hypothetical protein
VTSVTKTILKFTVQHVIRDKNGEYIIAETGQPLPKSIKESFGFLFPQSSDRKTKKIKD